MNKLDNPIESCEIKLDSTKEGVFEGYASVFGGIDAVNDTIEKGAYKTTLKGSRAPSMFVNHDSFQVPIGDWTQLKEDSTGLHVVGKIDLNHKDGPTVYSALKRGAMDAMSIGFQIPKGGAEEMEDGTRLLKTIDLKEISLVNFPADDAARIAIVKQNIEQIESLKDAEAILRDVGYSKAAAKAFVSRIKKMNRPDADPLEDEITKHNVTNQLIEIMKRKFK